MGVLQIESIEDPLERVGLAAARVLGRAEAMGLLAGTTPVRHLDTRVLLRLLREVVRVSGVGRDLVAELTGRAPSAERLSGALRRLYDELEASPVPQHEWRSLTRVLGLDLLTSLVGVSEVSARRYAAGERTTPDDVADRIHCLALVVADLAGSYNEFGLRRWFQRARPQLDGRSPQQLLRGAWRSDDPRAQKVRDLARALAAPLAT